MASDAPPPRKLAFVTIGATASFKQLIRAALEPAFFTTLAGAGYTDLLVQYGPDRQTFMSALTQDDIGEPLKPGLSPDLPVTEAFSTEDGLRVSGFSFRPTGLKTELLAAAGRLAPFSQEGCVLSHAGSGTILDALRVSVPLIVVPNTALLDNHQNELAEELSRLDYVVHCKLEDASGLAAALGQCERWKAKRARLPHVNKGDAARNMQAVLDEEAGFVNLD